jgi:WD40 repeat protein/DNA-binding XRE family transcriptional regulator
MKTSYGERDYTFGQAMLMLRTEIGLTQAGLAELLGVSRRAVGEWEAGNSYPKAEHLKQFIALAIKQQAFPIGCEAEAIRTLWQAARQKVLLDEQWLHLLQDQPHALSSLVAPLPVEGASEQTLPRLAPGPRVDWGDALAVPTFYGREQEQALLTQWVVQERCRVVSVLGMGGIGKSALTVHMMHLLSEHFEVVLFRSLRDAPSCETLLDDCLQVLSPQPLGTVPADLEQHISLLLAYLRKYRALLVLDNLETLLAEGEVTGQYRPSFEGYKRLLYLVATMEHQSCLLLTSREKLAELRLLEGKHSPVRSLRLSGLDMAACEQLLAEKDVVGTAQNRAWLVEMYGGNPLALKIIAETISDLFDGEISQFPTEDMVIFGSVADLLSEQFTRLSPLEQIVLYWLAIVRETLTLGELQVLLVTPLPRYKLLEAIDSLRRRSLIERGKRPASFTLQSVILEYVTERLITEVSSEILHSHLDRFLQHGLELASAREYVRQTQNQLLVVPLLARLQSMYQGRDEMEAQLLSLFDLLRTRSDQAQGYGPANLLALLHLQRGHLRNLNLSRLAIRGAYLQGSEMQGTSLAGALIRNSTFTDTLDAIWAVAISNNGTFWAAGSRCGEVRVWKNGGQTLYLTWQAHTDIVFTLAFSPDERTLATGSWDGTLKLWDLNSGALLWRGSHTNSVRRLAFAPDGGMLASSGRDALVRLWDPQSGANLQTLPHPGPVFAVTWSPDGRLLASGDFEGHIRLWELQQTQPATCVQTLPGHTNWLAELAFAPDGQTLASASWDRTVKLWEVANRRIGSLRQTLSGHQDRVFRVVWSTDGRIVASAGLDKTIWLWDVAQSRYRAALHGHTGDVYALAFTPDSKSLLSGSDDGTLRVWEVMSGQCIGFMQGYALSIHDIDWNPTGTHLVSGGTDRLVTVWQVASEGPPQILRGHRSFVFGVGWSPDGRWLASSEWDNVIRLWDPTAGTCVQVLRGYGHPLMGVAWSPDGQWLASGTYMHGAQVWEVTTSKRHWDEHTHPTPIRRVAWSPDGMWLAGGDEDGHVCLWEPSDGTLLHELSGHHGRVTSVAWHPDGTLLASAGGGRNGGELLVWDTQNWECVRTFAGHPAVIYAVTWSPPDNLLISGCSDGRLRWWDMQSGECVQMRVAHRGTVRSLRVNPDGVHLASCGDDGAIMLWNLCNGRHLRTIRHNRPYEQVNIINIRGVTEAQKTNLRNLGAIEEETTASKESADEEPIW